MSWPYSVIPYLPTIEAYIAITTSVKLFEMPMPVLFSLLSLLLSLFFMPLTVNLEAREATPRDGKLLHNELNNHSNYFPIKFSP